MPVQGSSSSFGWMQLSVRPCADKRHIALGDKITDGLRDRFIGIGERSRSLSEALVLLSGLARRVFRRYQRKSRYRRAYGLRWRQGGHEVVGTNLEAHDLVKCSLTRGTEMPIITWAVLPVMMRPLAPTATNDALSATMEGSATSTRRRVAQLVAPAILPTPPKS